MGLVLTFLVSLTAGLNIPVSSSLLCDRVSGAGQTDPPSTTQAPVKPYKRFCFNPISWEHFKVKRDHTPLQAVSHESYDVMRH